MTVTFHYGPDDYLAALSFAREHDRLFRLHFARQRRQAFLIMAVCLGLLAILCLDLLREYRRGRVLPATTLTLSLLSGLFAYGGFKLLVGGSERQAAKRHEQMVRTQDVIGDYGEMTITIEASGLRIDSPYGTMTRLWATGIDSIVEAQDHIMIYYQAGSAYSVPKHAFAGDREVQQFVALARARLAAAGGPKSAHALHKYLSEHESPCPTCGYSLSGLVGTRCPECGIRLTLSDFGVRSTSHLGLRDDAADSPTASEAEGRS